MIASTALQKRDVFLPASVYGELFRDAFTRMKGVGIYGLLPFGISYQAIYGATTVETDGGLVEAFESPNPAMNQKGREVVRRTRHINPNVA